MNESYYNNSAVNITYSIHCTGVQIGGVENNSHESINDSYKRGTYNNRTDRTLEHQNISEVNKNNDHHFAENDQSNKNNLVVNEKKKDFFLGDSMVKHT